MTTTKRYLWPFIAFFLEVGLLTILNFSIVSLVESPQHAVALSWADRWFVLPIILGFGVQSGLYVFLKKQLFIPVLYTGASGSMTGANGGKSTTAMVT